jgi:zinc transporter ZupT
MVGQSLSEGSKRTGNIRVIAGLLLPIVLLGIVIAASGSLGLTSLTGQFPTEEVSIERMTFQQNAIVLDVRNVGPIDSTVTTVFVNDAIWEFQANPGPHLARFATARITIPYQWVEGEPYTVMINTGPSNLKFTKTVDIAILTPRPNLANVLDLAIIGVIVGVIPVFLGLLWFPFLRRIGSQWMNYLLGITVGLLVFLGVDSIAEAVETAGELPGAFGGFGLIATGLAGTFLGLAIVSDRAIGMKKEKDRTLLFTIAYLVSLGIGLHNLGEGLAIGGAFALGAVALGSRLILGFTIHNTTEGLAILSPIIRQHPTIPQLGAMGLIAGVPTIFGAWIGGFVQLDIMAVLFLSIGAGAILEVVYEIFRQVRSGMTSLHGYSGIITGLIVMYATALLVAV